MSNAQSPRMQQFCFRVYRSACMFSQSLERMGAQRLSDAVYWFLPLKLCKIGYEIWDSELHREDFEAHLQRGKS